jgi:curli production assembly/transport component CsgE
MNFLTGSTILSILIAGLSISSAYAQADTTRVPVPLQNLVEDLQTDSSEQEIPGMEIDGLLVDETITKVGRDFYDLFYQNWEAPLGARNFTIVFKEKPVPGLGTLISLQIEDEEVFMQRLPPRYSIVEEFAKYAVFQARDHLQQKQQLQDQLELFDQSGSGIY